VPIDADEFDRRKALNEPLARSVRQLLDATIRTEADEDTIAEAVRAIDAVTARMRARQIDGARGIGFSTDGRGTTWSNPVIGVHNAFAPPLVIERDEHRCWADFDLGAAYEGPPNHVHGGVSALILDHILGEVASLGLTKPQFTGTITCKYLRGTPLGRLRAEAWVDRVDGIKTYAKGFIADVDGPTVEAEGVFIKPQWAR
jgi:acyl-coenzyme A thioesterase PaaI-like protein